MTIQHRSILKRFFLTVLWVGVVGAAVLGFALNAHAAPYEAESAALSGGAYVVTDHTGYIGSGFVAGFTDDKKGNAQVAFTVNATTTGHYTLGLRYANGTGASKTLSIYINGVKIKQTTLAATADWNTWSTQADTVTLNAGNNTVAYKYDTTDTGNVNIDDLTVNSAANTLPDLVVTSLTWNPGSPSAGKEVTFSVTVKNQGGAATPAGVKLGVNFTVDGAQVSWSDTDTSSLAAGDSITLTANNGPTGKASWTATPGTHTVTANVDDQNLIAESNESNNTLSASLVVPATSSAAYEAESAVLTGGTFVANDHTGYSGTGFVAGFTDANKGSAQVAFTVNAATTGSYALGLRYANGTAAAKTLSIYINGAKLKQTALGATTDWNTWNTQTDTVTLNAGSNTVAYKYDSTDTGNVNIDSLAVNSTTSNLPDLVVTALTWNPASPSAGNEVTFSVTVKNQGGAATPAGVKVGANFTVDGTQVSWSDTDTSSLAAGASITLTANNGPSGKASWTSTQGTHTVTATVDDQNLIAESIESNNTLSTSLTVAAAPLLPDLIVSGISWSPPKPTVGQPVTFSATVKNQGTGPTPAGVTNKVTFSVNGTVVTWVDNYNSALAAGASITLTANNGTAGPTWTFAGSAPTITATVNSTNAVVESNNSNNTLSTILTSQTYGASLPYTTYEAEAGSYTGALISGSRVWGQLSSEASGRAAVQLTVANQYAQVTLTAAAQGLVVRYSIPDTATGAAYNAGLSLYVNGVKKPDFVLTNKFSWIYGTWSTEGGQIRWSNNPAATPKNPHRFFDEVAVKLDSSYPAGTTIKLMRETSNLNFASTASVTVDFVEAEPIPAALAMPANFVPITSYGAIANDGLDDTAGLNSAIAAVKASGGTLAGVWLPPGTFTFSNGTAGPGYNGTGTRIYLDAGVSLRGAGLWYSAIEGPFAGMYAKGGNITISDFKVNAADVIRDDANGVSGIEGNLSNSTVSNVWFEHTKVGIWATQSFSQSGTVNNATIIGNRIRDTWADGLNLHYGTSNSTVSNNNVRNTGDDGMAMWSQTYLDTNNIFQFNTVQLPGLANGIAIYGGSNNQVSSNLIIDTVDNGSGISFGTNFSPPSITGTLTISGNQLIRTGSYQHDYGYNIGALWGYWLGSTGLINGLTVNLSNNLIQDSTFSAVLIEEPSTGAAVTYTGTQIVGTGTYGVEIRSSAVGSATFTGTTVTGVPLAHLINNSSSFTVNGAIP